MGLWCNRLLLIPEIYGSNPHYHLGTSAIHLFLSQYHSFLKTKQRTEVCASVGAIVIPLLCLGGKLALSPLIPWPKH